MITLRLSDRRSEVRQRPVVLTRVGRVIVAIWATVSMVLFVLELVL